MKQRLYILSLFLLLVSACGDVKKPGTTTDKKYFDLAGLIHKQVDELTAAKAKLKKNISVAENKEAHTADTVNWKQELQLFEDADINKPILRDAYRVEENNGAVRYIATEKNAKVREMVITGAPDRVSDITVHFNDNNQLYKTQRTLSMQLKDGKIASYSINGFQKIVLKDTVYYNLQAEVAY